jgi:DUF4097 and DUF4098 domain-containing protein YvlB
MKSHRVAVWGLCLAGICTLLLGGCIVIIAGDGDGGDHDLRAKTERTDELNAPLADITTVEVETNVGGIRVEAGDVTQAAITAKIAVRARTDEEAGALLEGVKISAEPSGHTLAIKAVKPAEFGKNSLIVNYTIVVPRQLEARCVTKVGDIRIKGLAGDLTASTDVGKIECTDLHGGKANLTTNVGPITMNYAEDAPTALKIEAATNVGDINLRGPEHMSARFSASTNVGDISANRQMKAHGSVGKSLEASLDSGEGRVALRTNVGAIHIR